jgi:F-type H+-transporting ATPase subunit b
MDLVTPAIGLIFWTVLIFLILLFLLFKFAWKPILGAVKAREKSISEALNAAEKARKDMEKLQASNEEVLNEARAERDQILKEAREMRSKMIEDAKGMAKEEAHKLVDAARSAIENEKRAAINEMKNTMANLSVEIAEKLLLNELSDKDKQQALIDNILKEKNFS